MLGFAGKNFEDDGRDEEFEEYPEFPVLDVDMKVSISKHSAD